MVLMIIKGLFRRYERWNPVHPTSGAFWGMGLGVGCGVGWGPGFGPEVIGYVGAGCGVGFSVGITLVGIGIGLPANWLFGVPYNAFRATRSAAKESAHSSDAIVKRNVKVDGWSNIGLQLSGLKRKASQRFSDLKSEQSLDRGIDLSDVKDIIFSHSTSFVDRLEKFKNRCIYPPKDSRE